MPPKDVPIRLAIIGTGGMAHHHAKKFKEIGGCEIAAACDIDRTRVDTFCADHGVAEAYTSEKELLKHAPIDAVSVVTPDAFHAPISIQCLRAGKHVLCEKPLAVCHEDAARMVAAARKSGRIHMVNLSYRDWPCLQEVATLILQGGLGEIRHVEASYLQAWLASKIWGDWRTTPAWLWRLSQKHGSKGVLGDIGVHIIDFATFPAGPIAKVFCRLKTFPKAPRNRIGEYVLDANDSAALTVEFKSGALGVIHTTRWSGGHANRLYLKISGTQGTVEIDSDRSIASYRICAGEGFDKVEWIEVKCAATPNNYERFLRSIRTGEQDQPDFVRGAEVQKILDACVESDRLGRMVKV
jgi:predicted dehydrogenase